MIGYFMFFLGIDFHLYDKIGTYLIISSYFQIGSPNCFGSKTVNSFRRKIIRHLWEPCQRGLLNSFKVFYWGVSRRFSLFCTFLEGSYM